VWAASLAELGGADGITLHLREDRRHSRSAICIWLRQTVTVKLNLELACEDQVLTIACRRSRTSDARARTPRRGETEGGLDAAGQRGRVGRCSQEASGHRIVVSLFSTPDAAADRGRGGAWRWEPSSFTPAPTPTDGAVRRRRGALPRCREPPRQVARLGPNAPRRSGADLSQCSPGGPRFPHVRAQIGHSMSPGRLWSAWSRPSAT